ncbi:MAG: phenylalanine--tRNA ligase subunit beta [bacterium]
MKILYSQIKELVPDLSADAKEVSEVLTMTGSMVDSFEKVEFKNSRDYLISLEIRQNRADCLSVIGVAREVAAYYGLRVKLPETKELDYTGNELDIKVKDKEFVKRILAVRIDHLKNQESPYWLKEFLAFYDINSVSILVDLSNYVMFYTGYTSHLLDMSKIHGGLIWSVNKDKVKIQTLDDTEDLGNNELIISDDENILALAGIIGCKIAAIDMNTTSIIAEMAIYDRALIMQNSRALGIVTEASNRLSKDLDPAKAEYAFNLLINLLLEHGHGRLTSQQYNYYTEKRKIEPISFDPYLASKIAGVDISKEKVIEILENLRFKVEDNNEDLKITFPSDRMDIEMEEDLAEEVIRMARFDSIPSDQVPSLEVVSDITPKIYYLKDKIRDFLSALGYDEILSQPLVGVNINSKTNWQDWENIITQNSVNDEFPDLRQSIASGLINQLNVYLKKNLNYIQIFEIGKVFGKKGKECLEHDSLGILSHDFSNNPGVNKFKKVVEQMLRYLGLAGIMYQASKTKPDVANPYAVWNIVVNDQIIGIIYKLKPLEQGQTTYFCELNLEIILELLLKSNINPAVEIMQKIVALDANLELASKYQLIDYLQKAREKIGFNNLWSIEIIDEYKLSEDKIRYTIRVSYQKMPDQEAKALHLKIFDLNI